MDYIFNDKSKKHLRRHLRKNSTKAEQILWEYLKNKRLLGYKFRRQFEIGNYIVDFYCPRLRVVIEIDGDSHFSTQEIIYDKVRQTFIESLNITVLRFTNLDIYHDLDGVIQTIKGIDKS